MKKNILVLIISVLVFVQSNGQCAMCRAVLENEDGQNTAEGINNGIVYLMAIPYILIAGIGLIIYRKFFRSK